MSTDSSHQPEILTSLSQAFLRQYPSDAARRMEMLTASDAAELIRGQPAQISARVLEKLTPGFVESVFFYLPDREVVGILEVMDVSVCINFLARLEPQRTSEFLALFNPGTASELRTLLDYPENCVGRLMNPRIIAFNQKTTVSQALGQLKHNGVQVIRHLFLVNDNMQLQSQVDVQRLALAESDASLASLAIPVTTHVHAMDHKDEVMEKLEKFHVDVLPVVDVEFRLVGVIEGKGLFDALREDIVTDMQTMVGASKDERALSSSLLAVRKRLPWLQINLLTAFLAASVVGIFEDTIARYTALAVLLPIAAGQSGNTGAQALAVTMRGLTLREITMRDWFRVLMKELAAGFINGVGIAVVCAGGVYLWSQSTGLALIMAIAMVTSMTIAGISGALVPILLKRFGQDPAQSSSIVLTTITDIAGFMAFLGTATLLSAMLDASGM